MKRKPNSRANRAIGWDRNRPALQPVADADMSRGELVSRQGERARSSLRLGAGGLDRAAVTNQRGTATL